MPASTLSKASALAVFLDEATYTHVRLQANPLTAALADDFTPFFSIWDVVNKQEIELRKDIIRHHALIGACDDDLDVIVDAVQQAVLLQTKNDRKAPLFRLYFGVKLPSELKQPVLGNQLEIMRGWIPSLQSSPSSVLSGLGERLQVKVAAADKVVASQAVAEQRNRDFRAIGERNDLVDNLNALRKATYGKLSELPHANPQEHLPATFAEPFFRHESGSKSAPLTTEALQRKVEEMQQGLAAAQAELAASVARDEAAAQARLEAEADSAELAKAEKEAAVAAAKVAALKAKKKR